MSCSPRGRRKSPSRSVTYRRTVSVMEENITFKARRRIRTEGEHLLWFVLLLPTGPKTLCGEISGDDRPGDSSHEGAIFNAMLSMFDGIFLMTFSA